MTHSEDGPHHDEKSEADKTDVVTEEQGDAPREGTAEVSPPNPEAQKHERRAAAVEDLDDPDDRDSDTGDRLLSRRWPWREALRYAAAEMLALIGGLAIVPMVLRTMKVIWSASNYVRVEESWLDFFGGHHTFGSMLMTHGLVYGLLWLREDGGRGPHPLIVGTINLVAGLAVLTGFLLLLSTLELLADGRLLLLLTAAVGGTLGLTPFTMLALKIRPRLPGMRRREMSVALFVITMLLFTVSGNSSHDFPADGTVRERGAWAGETFPVAYPFASDYFRSAPAMRRRLGDDLRVAMRSKKTNYVEVSDESLYAQFELFVEGSETNAICRFRADLVPPVDGRRDTQIENLRWIGCRLDGRDDLVLSLDAYGAVREEWMEVGGQYVHRGHRFDRVPAPARQEVRYGEEVADAGDELARSFFVDAPYLQRRWGRPLRVLVAPTPRDRVSTMGDRLRIGLERVIVIGPRGAGRCRLFAVYDLETARMERYDGAWCTSADGTELLLDDVGEVSYEVEPGGESSGQEESDAGE